jgi:HSP20 family protein
MPLPVRRRQAMSPARQGMGPRQGMPMPVQRWDPLRELEELQQATAELLQSAWSPGGDEAVAWLPLVDVEETEDAWMVEAELPGANPEDIDVELRDDELAVTGEIKERERQGILRRRTRRVGRFEYRVSLPGPTDPSQIEASLDNGVLTIRIPKPAQTRPQRIDVRSGGAEGSGRGGPETVDVGSGGSSGQGATGMSGSQAPGSQAPGSQAPGSGGASG